MEEETLDIAESSDLRITAQTRSLMRGVGKWCGVVSSLGFVISFGGFFILLLMFQDFTRYNGRLRDDEIMGLLLMTTGILIMFLFSRFLWVYRSKLKKSALLDSDVLMEKAFRGLRNAIIIIAIVFAIAVGILLLFAFLFLYFNFR